MTFTALDLKVHHRKIRDDHPEALRTRVHRALSWLIRSEQLEDDPDTRFMLQWVAFNAAYAREVGPEDRERNQLQRFLTMLVAVDHDKCLNALLFQQFTGPIRTLIENKFTYQPFWIALQTHDSSDQWKSGFAASKKAALGAVMGGDTAKVLGIVFDRLYVIRNQLMHGGATWGGQTNRRQLADGVLILGMVVPNIVRIMMDHPEEDYGDVLYPVVR